MHAHTTVAANAPARPDRSAGAASPQLRRAIAKFQRANRALDAAMAASGLPCGAAENDAASRAEDRAFNAVLKVPVRTRADMLVMLRHIAPGVNADPSECSLTMAIHMLRKLLGEDAGEPAPAAAALN